MAVQLFEDARNSTDILLRISALTDISMEKGKTLISFDEVQECKEIVTAINFLVDEGSYRYFLSGALLGVKLKDIRSVPVGYMVIHEMFPMDFFKFYRANRVSEQILEKMMDLFWLYLIVDGMPAAVRLMKKMYGIDMEAEGQHSKLLETLPPVHGIVTMGCNVQCLFLPCEWREDWGLDDPTGQPDEVFLETIRRIEEKILQLRDRVLLEKI